MKLRHNSESIIDDCGIELIVGYDYFVTPPQMEECHGWHDVGSLIMTELSSVEVVIKGTGIDILSRLTEPQKEYIISQLNYE